MLINEYGLKKRSIMQQSVTLPKVRNPYLQKLVQPQTVFPHVTTQSTSFSQVGLSAHLNSNINKSVEVTNDENSIENFNPVN